MYLQYLANLKLLMMQQIAEYRRRCSLLQRLVQQIAFVLLELLDLLRRELKDREGCEIRQQQTVCRAWKQPKLLTFFFVSRPSPTIQSQLKNILTGLDFVVMKEGRVVALLTAFQMVAIEESSKWFESVVLVNSISHGGSYGFRINCLSVPLLRREPQLEEGCVSGVKLRARVVFLLCFRWH